MKKNIYIKIAKEVIDLEIKALTKLKKSFDNSFNLAVEQILKCQSKVILCGVGNCLLYTSPSPRDKRQYRMPSSA